MANWIEVKGAAVNNLKHIDVRIPHNCFVVITGVSGSGKSSLAFDTIYREGQGSYLEALNISSGKVLQKLYQPKVDSIMGLTPTLAVNQKTSLRNPRSTVGTLTGLFDLFRLLFARFGQVSDPKIELSRNLFSFNSAKGACKQCNGLGLEEKINPEKLIADASKSIRDRAFVITAPNGYIIYSQVTLDVLDQVCCAHGFSVDIPWEELSPEQQNVVLYGSTKLRVPFGKHTLESRMKWTGITAKPREEGYYKGLIPVMEEILKRDRNKNILRFTESLPCSKCGGKRLNEEALSVTFDQKSIADFAGLTIQELHACFTRLQKGKKGPKSIFDAIVNKTEVLIRLGLSYLTTDRSAISLSGGEIQRIRLANQVNNGLSGLTYVFDEPSVGLHPGEQAALLSVLDELVVKGNTVIVVEHDEQTIKHADYLVDIGPYAGSKGGELLYQGKLSGLLNAGNDHFSLTKQALQQKFALNPLALHHNKIEFEIKSYHNLKHVLICLQENAINIITGVAGAGKSSILGSITRAFQNKNSLFEDFTQLVKVDQEPIGKNARSNPVTYTGLFDVIRTVFAQLPHAKARGWGRSQFSFNTKAGACPDCQGAGQITVGMHFLGDVEIECETCKGRRYKDEILDIRYKNLNISEVLDLTIDEAHEFFKDEPKIRKGLQVLRTIGLGYLKLGQSSSTLSGGEAQRIKLATHLMQKRNGKLLYLLDEPSTGLHPYDISALSLVLQQIVSEGNTIVLADNDENLIAASSWMLALGAGNQNKVVFNGKPSGFKAHDKMLRTENEALKAIHSQQVSNKLVIKNARTNNLKGLDVEIPYNALTCVTGVSGSGKSSLVFDTIYAEGQRWYLESLSTYARSYLKQLSPAKVDAISGLHPVVAINQSKPIHNPRSTVGTFSKLYDQLRLLYSRAAISENERAVQARFDTFSFNNEQGACPGCHGLGFMKKADVQKLIKDELKPLLDGALVKNKNLAFYADPYGQYVAILKQMCLEHQIDLLLPWKQLSKEQQDLIMNGSGSQNYHVSWHFKRKERTGIQELNRAWKGFLNLINEEYERKHDDHRAERLLPLMSDQKCSMCHGARLNSDALRFLIAGKNIAELSELPAQSLFNLLENWQTNLTGKQKIVFDEIWPGLKSSLTQMRELGIDYLSLDRRCDTLSGGEMQRLRLQKQLNSNLSGMVYLLDEPTVGLHSADTVHLLNKLDELKTKGNTIIVVEHDAELIKAADHIIEMGPGAGQKGGQCTRSLSIDQFLKNEKSLTARYLHKNWKIETRQNLSDFQHWMTFDQIKLRNIVDQQISIPQGGFAVITGVSGSGKSSLLFDVIGKSVESNKAVHCQSFSVAKPYSKVVRLSEVLSSGSVVATYSGIFDLIRSDFAQLSESAEKGFNKSWFSFNHKNGQCRKCKGQGRIKLPMDFLADVEILCEDCHGLRYKPEVLAVRFKEKSISDILEMEISEAANFFDAEKYKAVFDVFMDAGLGYLTLGQDVKTLSGGEAQRLTLVSEILKNKGSHNLYLFDEPTRGLHFKDVDQLLELFGKLLAAGHTLIATEHNLQLISKAGYVIEMGPGGGPEGGKVIFAGMPGHFVKEGSTPTSRALNHFLKV